MSTRSTRTSINKLHKISRRARVLALSVCLAWALPALNAHADVYVWRGGNGRWVDPIIGIPKAFLKAGWNVADMRPWASTWT